MKSNKSILNKPIETKMNSRLFFQETFGFNFKFNVPREKELLRIINVEKNIDKALSSIKNIFKSEDDSFFLTFIPLETSNYNISSLEEAFYILTKRITSVVEQNQIFLNNKLIKSVLIRSQSKKDNLDRIMIDKKTHEHSLDLIARFKHNDERLKILNMHYHDLLPEQANFDLFIHDEVLFNENDKLYVLKMNDLKDFQSKGLFNVEEYSVSKIILFKDEDSTLDFSVQYLITKDNDEILLKPKKIGDEKILITENQNIEIFKNKKDIEDYKNQIFNKNKKKVFSY